MRHASPVSSRFFGKDVEEVQRHFYISGDLNVELGMMCTDEDDIEELNEIYGSLCWQGHKHDPGGHQKFMWYSIMKEFKCKKSSTWSSYKERERGLHAQTTWE